MSYWKTILPKIKKVFEKNPKKAATAEFSKTFDDAKEEYSKEFEEKKVDLKSPVLELYELQSPEVKALVKDPKVSGLKKNSAAVQTYLKELEKIGFPGAKAVSEASTTFGPAYLQGPIKFIFEKVSSLITVEEKSREIDIATTSTEEPTTKTEEEPKELEIVVEEEKKEESKVEIVLEKKEEPKVEVKLEATKLPVVEPLPKVVEKIVPPAIEAPKVDAPKVEEIKPPTVVATKVEAIKPPTVVAPKVEEKKTEVAKPAVVETPKVVTLPPKAEPSKP